MNIASDQLSSLRTAEFVLPGHPDKLADAIADAIVAEARKRENRALVGVEVALHRNIVFIDGRVACPGAIDMDFTSIVRGVYKSAGYDPRFPPIPSRIKIVKDLCLGDLLPGEADFRAVADDQSITIGYANSITGTQGLPVEHALVRKLAMSLSRLRAKEPDLKLGPDAKVIVFLEESKDGRRFRLSDVSVSFQHAADWDSVEVTREIERCIHTELDRFAITVPGFEVASSALSINAAGDFIEGGPHGDNGLSGKKLVADFYGPRIPIGGGAMSGKDFWKADRAGPLIARDLAQLAVERFGCRECLVTLGIRPGDREFTIVRVELENKQSVDIAKLRGMVDLRLSSKNSWPDRCGDLIEVARWGHFTME